MNPREQVILVCSCFMELISAQNRPRHNKWLFFNFTRMEIKLFSIFKRLIRGNMEVENDARPS
jgi:hypothetical protein